MVAYEPLIPGRTAGRDTEAGAYCRDSIAVTLHALFAELYRSDTVRKIHELLSFVQDILKL